MHLSPRFRLGGIPAATHCKGGDILVYMNKVLSSNSPVTEEWVAQTQVQVLQGLAYVHAKRAAWPKPPASPPCVCVCVFAQLVRV